jgi:tRNA G26 N,N-dimethylase Trm1
MPYLDKYVPYLSEGGLLNLTFTNSRELFPASSAAETDDTSEYFTHGILRPHPDIGLHEFGLRSTWLAVSKKLGTLGRDVKPICCWSFQHGCRIMARVTRAASLQSVLRNHASLYTDFANTFAIVCPSSVTDSSRTIAVGSSTVCVKYVGEMWGGPMIDKELVQRIFEKSPQSSHVRLFLSRLLMANLITEAAEGSPSSSQLSLWGIYSRKKFFLHYLELESLPSLRSVCLALNEVAANCATELAQDRDAYLVSPLRDHI